MTEDRQRSFEARHGWKAPRAPRGTCWKCGKDVALTIPAAGTEYLTRTHKDPEGKRCDGSRDLPHGPIRDGRTGAIL